MFKPVFITCLFLLLITPNVGHSKIRGESIVESVSSKILKEKRELLIHLPNNYNLNKHKKYPVLYLLDGQRNFNHAIGTLDLLNQSKMAQEMIIVAIDNTHRTRDFTPTYDENYNEWGISGGADEFLDFLGQELIPYVNKHYRSNNFKVLSGHSLGGLLSLYALQSRPEMFQAYFAFSPSLWWHDQIMLPQAIQFYSDSKELNKYLYINMGSEGGKMLSSYEQYIEVVNEHKPTGFTFDYDLDVSESHNTTALAGQSLAYQNLFASLQPKKEIISKGIEHIEEFYSQQSKKYGFEAKPSFNSINAAGYHALSNEDFDKAIKIFQMNVERHPNKADAYDSLADGLEAKGELQKAFQIRKIVIEKSVKENVESNSYKTRLINLENKIKGQGIG